LQVGTISTHTVFIHRFDFVVKNSVAASLHLAFAEATFTISSDSSDLYFRWSFTSGENMLPVSAA